MRALICSTRMPEYDRECGSKRVFDLLAALRSAGWSITYVAQRAGPRDRYAAELRRAGIPTYVGLETLSRRFLTEARFDLAFVAFWHIAEQCLPPLRRYSPYTRVIVDSIDLHFLRNARAAFHAGRQPASRPLDAAAGDEFVRELNTYAAADAVLAVSRKEAHLLADLLADPDAAHAVPLCEELPRSTIPFHERKGMLFVGNFWHQPNVDAATYLLDEILPKVNPRLLADHPLWIVGNASEKLAAAVRSNDAVRVVGWVPSLLPYVSRVRLTTVPLRYGAGIKGKLVGSLMAGTPGVSTTLGIEGLGLTPGRDVAVGDDAAAFAAAIERVVTEEALWRSLAESGRRTLCEVHGRDAVASRFLRVVERVLARPAKPASPHWDAEDPYALLRTKTKAAVERVVPSGAIVAVISRGDEALIELPGRRGEHFPRLDDGRYAGAYPADGRAAVSELDRACARGAEYLVVPATAFWWLDFYKEFAAFLDARADRVWNDESCRIYRLTAVLAADRPPQPDAAVASVESAAVLAARPPRRTVRPTIAPAFAGREPGEPKPRVLVLGIYLMGQPNHAVDEIDVLRAAAGCDVDQRWIALGGDPIPEVADVTVASTREQVPKFTLLNRLLEAVDLPRYDYVVCIDDDVVLPHGFLDALVAAQQDFGFALAQPARTSDSYYDHPIVEQQRGVLARRTMFVEIGPVFSVHRSIYDLIFPFDVTSSMGWGYENVWAYRLRARGARMGIVDAVPVAHSLRKSVVNYRWHVADAERSALLAKHPHLELDECFRVVDIIEADEAEYA